MLNTSFSSKSFLSCFVSSSLLTLAFTSCACTDNRKPQVKHDQDPKNTSQEIAQVTDLATAKGEVHKAVAKVHPLGDHQVSGIVTFTKVPEGIKIVADVQGLKPGKHGFHVHEHGDCSGMDGMKAGGHFNPTNSQHGGPDSKERHVGDFGNLEADERGRAYYERIDNLISFEGPNSILERSIIIHADPDDFVTQPTGNSGPRIACAKVEAVKQ